MTIKPKEKIKKTKRALKREILSRKKLLKLGRTTNRHQIALIRALEEACRHAATMTLVFAFLFLSMPVMAWDYGFQPQNTVGSQYGQNPSQYQQPNPPQYQPNVYNNYQVYPQNNPNEVRREEVLKGYRR